MAVGRKWRGVGVRDVDENNLSHHFLEAAVVHPELAGESGAGAGSPLWHDLTSRHGDVA